MPDASQSNQLSALAVGLDIGTTSVKAVAADEAGNIVTRSRLASKLVFEPAGRFEHDALATWWDCPRALLGEVVGQVRQLGAREPQAVAVSAMVPSVAAVGSSGRPLGPGILYGDIRGQSRPPGRPPAAEPQRMGADPTGSDEMTCLASWAASAAPGAAGYWPAQAVANASLGGEGVMDLASAFASGPLFGAEGWDPSVCEAAGLVPGQLPRVVFFGEAIGKVRPDLFAGEPADMVLGAGSVDGFCEQLVSGAVQDGDVFLGLGSTLVVWLTVPGWPEEVPNIWRAPHFAAGKALLGGASTAGGTWVDWVDRVVRPAEMGPEDGPGDVPLWWPWAKGERAPLHDRSLRIGLAGADISHGPAALRRAAYEATGFVARSIVELAATAGTSPQRVVVSGGGVRNPRWLSAVAEVLGRPVVPMAFPDGAALGAAFLARMAVGLETSLDDAGRWARWSSPVEPRPEWAAAADERYQRWREGLPTVGGTGVKGPA